jgi:hypothetical protein
MEIDRELIFYFIIVVVVLAVMLRMSGGLSDLIFGKGVQYSRLFERGALKIINEPIIEFGCNQNTGTNTYDYVTILKKARYNYEGSEDELDFVMLLDFKGDFAGSIMFGYTQDGGIIHFSRDASNEIQRMAFVSSSPNPPDQKEELLHFTMWRASAADTAVRDYIIKYCSTKDKENCNLHSLINDRYGYYLASFDMKLDMLYFSSGSGGCAGDICKLFPEDECSKGNKCHWISGIFSGSIFGECVPNT